uniref:Uncharacterized protein n=1 Tax=Rhizophora mucronata TaxID=61149 RepID=A0A2P2QAA9_RHIMU
MINLISIKSSPQWLASHVSGHQISSIITSKCLKNKVSIICY